MVDTNLLISALALRGVRHFVQAITDVLECSRVTASNKLNGKTAFTTIDIAKLEKEYNFSAEEIKNIFIGSE